MKKKVKTSLIIVSIFAIFLIAAIIFFIINYGSRCENNKCINNRENSTNDCEYYGGYCAAECKVGDGVVYLSGCPSGQVCCMPNK